MNLKPIADMLKLEAQQLRTEKFLKEHSTERPGNNAGKPCTANQVYELLLENQIAIMDTLSKMRRVQINENDNG